MEEPQSPNNTDHHNQHASKEIEKLDILGFINISSQIRRIHPNLTLLVTVDGHTNYASWPRFTNPAYSYMDVPIPGWKMELIVHLSGKRTGKLDVTYVSPGHSMGAIRRHRTRGDLKSYFSKLIPSQNDQLYLDLCAPFSFHKRFCVCHNSRTESASYIECSFGKGGCHGWIHPQCVGLPDSLSSQELSDLGHVVCPLCVLYLEGCGKLQEFRSQLEKSST